MPPVALISCCSASAAAGGSDLARPTLVGASGSHKSIDLTGGYLWGRVRARVRVRPTRTKKP